MNAPLFNKEKMAPLARVYGFETNSTHGGGGLKKK